MKYKLQVINIIISCSAICVSYTDILASIDLQTEKISRTTTILPHTHSSVTQQIMRYRPEDRTLRIISDPVRRPFLRYSIQRQTDRFCVESYPACLAHLEFTRYEYVFSI